MTISLRLSDEDSNIIKTYAKLKKQSVSEILRNAVMEQIENEYDLECYEKAMSKYNKNPISFSHDEVGKMLGMK